ncbi:MAG TPA: hypothetical protein VK615_05805 [Candidatus Binatia bacterium]|nr:hypothetical protein [Candidatus Binatia bacterium]
MSADAREGHIDYVEFPAQSPEAFAAAKRFYREVFGGWTANGGPAAAGLQSARLVRPPQ